MRMRTFTHPLLPIALFAFTANNVLAEDIAYIAGTNPAARPATAPTLTAVNHDAAWYATALQGVAQPYPSSLHFLENQGDWFSPFTHPGMPGRYDLRGWHGGK